MRVQRSRLWAAGVTVAGLVLACWLTSRRHDVAPTRVSLPPSVPVASPAPAAPRGTTFVVLRVAREASPQVVGVFHKDALPWVPDGESSLVRYRVHTPEGELVGACSWPRLCRCEASASHARGCVRVPHEASVRLRLPRLRATSRVVIERRSGGGWLSLAELEVSV